MAFCVPITGASFPPLKDGEIGYTYTPQPDGTLKKTPLKLPEPPAQQEPSEQDRLEEEIIDFRRKHIDDPYHSDEDSTLFMLGPSDPEEARKWYSLIKRAVKMYEERESGK